MTRDDRDPFEPLPRLTDPMAARTAEEAEAARLLSATRVLPDWPPAAKERLLRRLSVRAHESRRPVWRLLVPYTVAVLAASMAALILTVGLRGASHLARGPLSVALPPVQARAIQTSVVRPGWSPLDLGAAGRLEIGPGASYRLADRGEVPSSEIRVYLGHGALDAQIVHRPGARFVVVTPALRVEDVGTHFEVTVSDVLTRVLVDEGAVRIVGRDGPAVDLGAGESIRSDDARLVARASSPPERSSPSLSPACPASGPFALRETCLEALARGEGVAAQNALYTIGLVERDEQHDGVAALASFRRYEERFPDGLLAPEASVAALDELLAEERFPEARAEAERYLARFPDGTRAGEVALIRANLLCQHLGLPEEAISGYDALFQRPAAVALRAETLFQEGLCQRLLGRETDARATFARYVEEFPAGSHAEDAARLSR